MKKKIRLIGLVLISILLSNFVLSSVVSASSINNDNISTEIKTNDNNYYSSISNEEIFDICRKNNVDPVKILGTKDYLEALSEDKQRSNKNWFHLYKKHGHWYITVGLSSHVIKILKSSSISTASKILKDILTKLGGKSGKLLGYVIGAMMSTLKYGFHNKGEWWHFRVFPFHLVSHGYQ